MYLFVYCLCHVLDILVNLPLFGVLFNSALGLYQQIVQLVNLESSNQVAPY